MSAAGHLRSKAKWSFPRCWSPLGNGVGNTSSINADDCGEFGDRFPEFVAQSRA